MKEMKKPALRPLVLPALVLFLSLVIVLFASLHLDFLRHERMIPSLNKALANNGLTLRVAPLGSISLLFDASRYRADSAPSILRFPLENGAGILWVFVMHAGGFNAQVLVAEYPDGTFCLPLPCDEVSAHQLPFLPPGLLDASLLRLKRVAGGYRNE